ncbi:MAG: hypothetical protein ABIN97_18480 [Ginsengibacter sp.]
MQTSRNRNLLFNWIFISGIILLALNDHYLKWQFPGWLTGKISDFAGLLILPIFLAYLFPNIIRIASLLSGLFFIFWKLPVSENFIRLYNEIALIPIVRTVDYTDLIALSILPFSHLLIYRIEISKINKPPKFSVNPLFIVIPCSFILMATSPPISYYMRPNGDIHIGKSYQMKVSKEKILQKLKNEGFAVRLDTSKQDLGLREYYLIENIVLAGGKDTIKCIQFGFKGNINKPLLLLNNVTLKGEWKISDWKVLKKYSKHYRKLINSEIIEDLKK